MWQKYRFCGANKQPEIFHHHPPWPGTKYFWVQLKFDCITRYNWHMIKEPLWLTPDTRAIIITEQVLITRRWCIIEVIRIIFHWYCVEQVPGSRHMIWMSVPPQLSSRIMGRSFNTIDNLKHWAARLCMTMCWGKARGLSLVEKQSQYNIILERPGDNY